MRVSFYLFFWNLDIIVELLKMKNSVMRFCHFIFKLIDIHGLKPCLVEIFDWAISLIRDYRRTRRKWVKSVVVLTFLNLWYYAVLLTWTSSVLPGINSLQSRYSHSLCRGTAGYSSSTKTYEPKNYLHEQRTKKSKWIQNCWRGLLVGMRLVLLRATKEING